MTHRVLITGSRTWTDVLTIRVALRRIWGDGTAIMVSGACPRGADSLAEQVWRQRDGQVEQHPADCANQDELITLDHIHGDRWTVR